MESSVPSSLLPNEQIIIVDLERAYSNENKPLLKIKNLIDYITELPPYLGREIFSFLMLDESIINFTEHIPEAYKTNYSKKYQLAYRVFCKLPQPSVSPPEIWSLSKTLYNNGFFLSRIYKKNLKHRYYLTTRIIVIICSSCGSSICMNPYCNGTLEEEQYYMSKYIGKNLNKALFYFYFEKIIF
jgi:hypothetical protein